MKKELPQKVVKVLEELKTLWLSEQILVVGTWLADQPQEVVNKVFEFVEFGSGKMDKWFERRLSGNTALSPRRVAEEFMYYYRVPVSMYPYLLKLAQRVKDRIRKRHKKS